MSYVLWDDYLTVNQARWTKYIQERLCNLKDVQVKYYTQTSRNYLDKDHLSVEVYATEVHKPTGKGLPQGAEPQSLIVAEFILSFMPNTIRIMVSSHFIVYQQFRRRGVATELMRLKRMIAKDVMSYGMICNGMICIVSYANEAEQKCIEKLGWKKLQVFGDPKFPALNTILYSTTLEDRFFI